MLINLTNHQSNKWSEEQLKVSKLYGKIIDMDFPQIDAYADEEDIEKIVDVYIKKILDISDNPVVLCQGEMCFVFHITNRLIDLGIKVISATSQRIVKEIFEENQCKKVAIFVFAKYREYKR